MYEHNIFDIIYQGASDLSILYIEYCVPNVPNADLKFNTYNLWLKMITIVPFRMIFMFYETIFSFQ